MRDQLAVVSDVMARIPQSARLAAVPSPWTAPPCRRSSTSLHCLCTSHSVRHGTFVCACACAHFKGC